MTLSRPTASPIPLLALVVGLAATLALSSSFWEQDRELQRSDFEARSAWRLVVLEREVDRIVAVLEQVGALFDASEEVQALEILQVEGDRIDIVVLDQSMPRMTGVEVHEEVRINRPDLPVILSSGFSEEEILGRIDRSGPTAFLAKPYRVQRLVGLIRSMLGPSSDPAGDGGSGDPDPQTICEDPGGKETFSVP